MSKVLETAKLDLDDNVIIGIENGSHVDLFEFYKIAENQGPIEYNNVGAWSNGDGLRCGIFGFCLLSFLSLSQFVFFSLILRE